MLVIRTALSAAAAVLLALSSVGFAPLASGAAERPSWLIGNFWQYDGWQRSGPLPGGRYAHRVEVADIESVNASGIQYEAYRLNDTWTFPTGGTVLTKMWHTTNGLALISVENPFPVMFLGFCASGTCSSTYDPPIPLYQFPLHTGKQWSATSTRTLLTDSGATTDTIVVTMRVSSEESVLVSLNGTGQTATRTFRTFAVGVTSVQIGTDVYSYSPFAILFYYAEEVGLWVKVEQYYQDGTTAGEYNLTDYRYSKRAAMSPWVFLGLGVTFGAGLVTAVLLFRWRRTRLVSRIPPNRPNS